VHFEPLRGIQLSPASTTIPDITARRYDICGHTSPAPATVTITSSAAGAPAASVRADSTGVFCYAALPGTYTLAAMPQSVADSAVRYVPEKHVVTVVAAPVLDTDFSRELYPVHGTVAAKQPTAEACSALRVSIAPAVAAAADVATDCSFAFPPVAPGKYTLSILGAANWCWESSTLTTVAQRGADPVQFVQTGFAAPIHSSHPVEVTATHIATGKQLTARAPDTVCLPEQGSYRIVPSKAAPYIFDADEYIFDGSAPVVMTARKFRVSGSVSSALLAAGTLAVRVDVFAADNTTLVGTHQTETTAEGTFHAWAERGQTIVFTPDAPPPVVCYPPKREAHLAPSATIAAPITLEPIACRPGKFISGTIDPATKGVRVTIVDRTTNEPAAIVETDVAGQFSVGPLRDDREYEELFFAPGLVFERDAKNQTIVHALRLAALTAMVRDAQTGAPLPGVLISVSGSNGYHSNGVTAADGTLSTGQLVPGDYFARPMLAEYVFKPAHGSVRVNEGESLVLEFAGERVAFSVRGRVIALDGSPIAGAVVTATSQRDNSQRQQATVGEDGLYRVRGLTPGESYTVSVATPTAQLFQTSPATRNVVLGRADATGADFVAVPLDKTSAVCRVRVQVNASADVLPTLEALISGPSGSPDSAVRRTKTGIAPFAEFGALTTGKYEVRLTTSLSPQHFACHSTPEVASVELTPDNCDLRTELAFVCGKQLLDISKQAAAPKTVATTAPSTSLFSLIALIILLVAAANYKTLWATALIAWKWLRGQEVQRTRPAPEEIASTFLPKGIFAQQRRQQKARASNK